MFWKSNFILGKSKIFGHFRILAGYQGCNLTCQFNISSKNLMLLADHSKIWIRVMRIRSNTFGNPLIQAILPNDELHLHQMPCLASWPCQKVPKLDFQNEFSTSKIIQIFLQKIFIEEYQFKRTFFVKSIFC